MVTGLGRQKSWSELGYHIELEAKPGKKQAYYGHVDDPTEPGMLHGPVRILVKDGKPVNKIGRELMKRIQLADALRPGSESRTS